MKLLLDTCALIWLFAGSDRISDRLRDLLTDPVNDLRMSDVSVLELVLKHQLGKLGWAQAPSRLVPVLVRKHRLDVEPMTAQAIYQLERLPLLHRDPFDRLLVAQAVLSGCVLVTPDPLIRQYPVKTVW
jgi:PIN domain nuclease of toxin-antitoxin system